MRPEGVAHVQAMMMTSRSRWWSRSKGTRISSSDIQAVLSVCNPRAPVSLTQRSTHLCRYQAWIFTDDAAGLGRRLQAEWSSLAGKAREVWHGGLIRHAGTSPRHS